MLRLTDAHLHHGLSDVVGAAHVIDDPDDLARRMTATFVTSQRVRAVARPGGVDEVAGCVRWARRHGLLLHTVSRGQNWGYGSSVPSDDDCVLLDLGRLDEIVVDAARAVVTIGAGVTQGQLYEALRREAPGLLHSVTGSSPTSSIVGNAVDGGTANGLHTVRWDHVLAATVVTGDGEVLRLGRAGADPAGLASRAVPSAGVLGLFRQSALGVVVDLTLEVPVAPAGAHLLFFSADDHAALAPAVDELSRRQRARMLDGNWHIANVFRVLAEHRSFPTGEIAAPLGRVEALALLRGIGCDAWDGALNGVAAVYPPSERRWSGCRADLDDLRHVLALRSVLVSFDRDGLEDLHRGSGAPRSTCPSVQGRCASFTGVQGAGTAAVAYWRKPGTVPSMPDLDRDRCGFVWVPRLFAPGGATVARAVERAEGVAADHGLEAQVVIDGVTGRDVMVMTALAWDRDEPGADAAAARCARLIAASLDLLGGFAFRRPLLDLGGLGASSDEVAAALAHVGDGTPFGAHRHTLARRAAGAARLVGERVHRPGATRLP